VVPAAPAPAVRPPQIDGPGRDVRLDGESIPLSTADFDLLWELACHAGQILGREALFHSLRGATTTARIAAWTWPSPVCAAGSGMTATTRPASRRCAKRVIYSYPSLGMSWCLTRLHTEAGE
jgi:hypothetical protein